MRQISLGLCIERLVEDNIKSRTEALFDEAELITDERRKAIVSEEWNKLECAIGVLEETYSTGKHVETASSFSLGTKDYHSNTSDIKPAFCELNEAINSVLNSLNSNIRLSDKISTT